MIQGNNGKNGKDGIKGDKGDVGMQGLRGIQVEINIIVSSSLFSLNVFILWLVFFTG